jgi:hypothetical protein
VALFRGLFVWVIIMVAEVLHGTARVAFLEPSVGDFRARQIAVFTGSAMLLAMTIIFARWIGASSVRQWIGIGLLWLGLTLAFEVLFGRLVMGYSWERLTSDYNLLRGGLLPIGLLVLAVAPLIAAKVRGVMA